MHDRELTPWVRDLIASYRGGIETLRHLQRRVRERCPALLRLEGKPVLLTAERVPILRETMVEVEHLVTSGEVSGGERVRIALAAVRQEMERVELLMNGGVQEVEVTDDLRDAIGEVQAILRAVRGLTGNGSIKAAYPRRLGNSAGQTTDAFPECTFCPMRRTCPLKDMQLLAEAIGDMTFGMGWLRERYLPLDNPLGSDGMVQTKWQRHVDFLDPHELLPLAEQYGRPEPDPEEIVLLAERERRFRDLIEGERLGLTESQRDAVKLYYLEGFSVGSVARILGCTHTAVGCRLAYAERKYQAYLASRSDT